MMESDGNRMGQAAGKYKPEGQSEGAWATVHYRTPRTGAMQAVCPHTAALQHAPAVFAFGLKKIRQKKPAATLDMVNRVNSGWQHETDSTSEWDRWLAQYAPKLLLYARQQSRCAADACDLVQDAVVESWRHKS